ncbi:MAG: hypothetical protein M3552_02710 [Planctomycetota bacterium]|nr:hypothetical protein [Planctomycetaceae bacterium]MDQ3329558.1 hypothetical protein [Planctomycetota bacterium]
MSNPLDPVIAWFTTARDALRIAKRSITRKPLGLITDRHTQFFGIPAEQATDNVVAAEEELNRLVVLALVAVFERTLRDSIINRSTPHLPNASLTDRRIIDQITQDIEFWHFSQRLLEVFDTVELALRGQVRQLVEYRNWVAHGRSAVAPPPVNVLPQLAYERLSKFLQEAGIITV